MSSAPTAEQPRGHRRDGGLEPRHGWLRRARVCDGRRCRATRVRVVGLPRQGGARRDPRWLLRGRAGRGDDGANRARAHHLRCGLWCKQVGLALKGSNLSINTVRAVGSLAGAIAGAGARTGGFLVIRHVQGRVVETMNLVMEVVHGALGGAAAGFRGVEAVVMPVAVNDAGHAVVLQAFEEPTHVVRYDQTFLEAWEHPDIGHIGLIAGWQDPNGINGTGLLHIMYRHPDVFKPLGYSANDVGQAMLGGPGSDRFKELACAVRGWRCFLSPVLLYK